VAALFDPYGDAVWGRSGPFNEWIAIAPQSIEIVQVERCQPFNSRFPRCNEVHVVVDGPTPHTLLAGIALGGHNIVDADFNKPHAWQDTFANHGSGNVSINPDAKSATCEGSKDFV
jgi:hypothetical protein